MGAEQGGRGFHGFAAEEARAAGANNESAAAQRRRDAQELADMPPSQKAAGRWGVSRAMNVEREAQEELFYFGTARLRVLRE
jgi:hypothetical protein